MLGSKMVLREYFKRNSTNLTIATIVVLVVIISGVFWLTARAAGFFSAVEPDNATLTTNAKVITDLTASGGKAIEFGSGSIAPDIGSCTTKPDAMNTGTSGALTADSRTVLRTANEVIQNKSFPAGIDIQADGVQLRNVQVKGRILVNEADNVVIDHVKAVEISISSSSNVAIQYAHVTAFEGDSFHFTSDGSSYIKNVTIKHNYVDRPGFNAGSQSHWDGVQIRGAEYVTIYCNNFDVGAWQDPYNVLIYLEQANGGNNHIVIDSNWLNGSNFAIMAGLPNLPMSFTIKNNKLRSADFHYGLCYLGGGFNSTYLGQIVQTGNTLDGAPIAQVCKASDL
jgi:hypothetical protein